MRFVYFDRQSLSAGVPLGTGRTTFSENSLPGIKPRAGLGPRLFSGPDIREPRLCGREQHGEYGAAAGRGPRVLCRRAATVRPRYDGRKQRGNPRSRPGRSGKSRRDGAPWWEAKKYDCARGANPDSGPPVDDGFPVKVTRTTTDRPPYSSFLLRYVFILTFFNFFVKHFLISFSVFLLWCSGPA